MGSWWRSFSDESYVSEYACISNTNIIINVYTLMCTKSRYAAYCCMTYRWYLREAWSVPLEDQIFLLKLYKFFLWNVWFVYTIPNCIVCVVVFSFCWEILHGNAKCQCWEHNWQTLCGERFPVPFQLQFILKCPVTLHLKHGKCRT